jgi:hypothetical protein
VICGEVIDEYSTHTRKYCNDQRCKWEYFNRIHQQARNSRVSLKHKRENLNQKAHVLRDNVAGESGIENPEDFTPVAIPANIKCIRHLPEKRQRSFSNGLKQLIEQVVAERSSSAVLTDYSTTQTDCDTQTPEMELRSILCNACAVCKGGCCVNGGEHAYIKADTLLCYMQQHPGLQPQQVLDEYLSFLPEKAYENSCVYHTELGCALPFHMRSESCSSFVCEGLTEIKEQAVNTKTTRFFVAAMEGKKVLRSAFIEANQIRGHHVYF